MQNEREYDREKFKFDHDLLRFYDRILDARLETGDMLSRYKATEKGLGDLDIQEEMAAEEHTEKMFKHSLDRYYDLAGNKFSKADDTDKPDFVQEKKDEEGYFTPHDLGLDQAIKLYKKLNELLEELEITSLENLDKGRRKI